MTDSDQIALDAAHKIEALPRDLHKAQKTARIQLIVLDALAAQPAQAAVGGEPVAWRSRHSARTWTYHEDKLTGPSAHLFETQPLYAAQPASPLRGRIEDALSRPGSMVFLDGRNEHGSHVLPSLPTNLPPEYENSLGDYAEEIIAAAERLGFKVMDSVWTEWRWNKEDRGDWGRIEVPGYWEFVRVNADATRALGASPPEQPAAAPVGQSMDEAAADNFGLTVDDLDEGDDE